MEIRNLEHTDFDILMRGFGNAFADYAIHFDRDEVRAMLRRRGFNSRLSFAAFDGAEIAAFTFNGTGFFNDIPTAYDTGTGTAPRYRGRGLAGEIFRRSIPRLREAGIRQYLLEVLQSNRQAINIYSRMGFETTREFDCFRQSISGLHFPVRANVDGEDCCVAPIGIEEVSRGQQFCDFNPSWQNSFDSIMRGQEGLTALGAFNDGQMVGFCVFDRSTGDLTQIAVDKQQRRRGIASRLLRESVGLLATDFIKVINVPSGSETLPAFLARMSVAPASKQFEMVLPL